MDSMKPEKPLVIQTGMGNSGAGGVLPEGRHPNKRCTSYKEQCGRSAVCNVAGKFPGRGRGYARQMEMQGGIHVRLSPFESAFVQLPGSVPCRCGNHGLDSIRVSPAAQSVAVGQTAQFTAAGTYGNANHPSTRECNEHGDLDLERSFRGDRQCFRGGNGCKCGHDNITASATAFNGPVVRAQPLQLQVQAEAQGKWGNLLSLTIIPSSITVGNLRIPGNSWRSERSRPLHPSGT